MISALIYDLTTGAVLQTVAGGSEADIAAAVGPGQGYAIAQHRETDETHYVKNGTLMAYPPKPEGLVEWDLQHEAWLDPRTLDELKAAKWDEIKDARTAADATGFTWNGSRFDSDPASQARIQGGVLLATVIGAQFTQDWTLADNTVRTLSQADMVAVGIAMSQHVAALFQRARVLRAQILAASVAAEVAAVQWGP